jgi:hypothetical protein
MALMNCPECAKEISDKSAVCIHCGYPIEKTPANAAQSDGFVSASNQDTTHAGQKKSIAKTRWLYPVLGLTVLLMVGTFGWYSYAEKQAEQQAKQTHKTYQAGAYDLMSEMLNTVVKAEKMTTLNINVWHDAINDTDSPTTEKYIWDKNYGYLDFNSAFLNMAADPDISKARQEILTEKLAIQTSLKALLPTPEQTATHQKLLALYALFEEYTSLAFPEGSYTSYTEQEATSKASFLRIVSELKIELTAPENVAK